jgi:hypothetical protein
LSAEERETLDRLFAHSPALKAAYTLRELLTEVFDTAASKAQASVYLQG